MTTEDTIEEDAMTDFQPEDTIIVRAHMNTGGYGGQSLRGTVSAGLVLAEIAADFAADVEKREPLPSDCAF